jgi:DNA-binding MarR family transcriptional regulator
MVTLVADERRDLNARQLAIFLTCYLSEGPHTVRGLAKHLNVSKPAITRALDTLTEAELVVRKPEPGDRRSVVVKRTAMGATFLRDLRTIMGKAAATQDGSAAEANHPTARPPKKDGRT